MELSSNKLFTFKNAALIISILGILGFTTKAYSECPVPSFDEFGSRSILEQHVKRLEESSSRYAQMSELSQGVESIDFLVKSIDLQSEALSYFDDLLAWQQEAVVEQCLPTLSGMKQAIHWYLVDDELTPQRDGELYIVAPKYVDIEENTEGPIFTIKTTVDPAELTFDIVGGRDAESFTIDAETGELSFSAPPDFENPHDYNLDNVYEVVVFAEKGEEINKKKLFVQITDGLDSDSLEYYNAWPSINSRIATDAQLENEVASILAQMTLEEKVGQMIQPNLDQVSPEEAAQYKLGSLLNGGGSWPNNNKQASTAEWVAVADSYWEAVDAAFNDRPFKIPFMWATDAVHGHNNVYGATVFPHNIGLGATFDPDLIYRIGQITAKEVAITGLDWTFAPTVATPRDLRWGRTYEGYSEDPDITYQYAGRMVEGIQGSSDDLKTDEHVISNVKHWVGDGGTNKGADRGENHYSEDYLRNIHAAGYFSGLEAGAQVVMSSFNSWHNDANYSPPGLPDYNKKVHGSEYLITDVLKGQMGFDGLVITDWNGQGEINGCTASDCPEAVNAGNDIFMVTANVDWKAFYNNVLAQVNDGIIPMERIDDAVTRILRVKMRAGLWDKPKPSERSLAGNQDLLGSTPHRNVAREAVSKSLVLLSNQDNVLPLRDGQKIYIGGSAANNISKQTGGWSLTWQGTENRLSDFPGATTLLMALQEQVGAENIVTSIDEADTDTVAVIAIGEDPYAEFFGDIQDHQTLGFSRLRASYSDDVQAVLDAKERGLKVVTIFFSGRPMYVNDILVNSDAFVAAWLPGTEAGGITDVLYAVDGADFSGRLSYSWPNTQCSTSINKVPSHIAGFTVPDNEQSLIGEHAPLFEYGYGLTYESDASEGPNLASIVLDGRDYGCGQNEPDGSIATIPLEVYGRNSDSSHVLRISGANNGWAPISVSGQEFTDQGNVSTQPINYQAQFDAIHVEFDGEALAQLYAQTPDESAVDRNSYKNANSTLQFDIRVEESPTKTLTLAQHCVWPCLGDVVINNALPAPSNDWSTVKVPLACFEEKGMNFALTNTPFLFLTDGIAKFDLGNIRIVPDSVDAAEDAATCEELAAPIAPPLTENPSYLLNSDEWNATVNLWTAQTGSDWSPSEGFVTITTEGSGNATQVNAIYSTEKPASDKGIVLIQGDSQNLEGFITDGVVKFDLLVNDYAENSAGMVVKFEGAGIVGADYFIGEAINYPAGSWHEISIALSDMNISDELLRKVTTFSILPAWGDSQLGVSFSIKNVRLEK